MLHRYYNVSYQRLVTYLIMLRIVLMKYVLSKFSLMTQIKYILFIHHFSVVEFKLEKKKCLRASSFSFVFIPRKTN